MDPVEYDKMFALEDRHFWFAGKRAVIAAIVRRHLASLQAPSAREILDVGCGTGANLRLLSQFGSAVGLDVSEKAVAHCRERGLGALVQQGSANHLPFADGRFALVTMFDVLYHRDIVLDDALAEVRRVLAPGGHLLVTDSALPWLRGPHDEAVWARERFTKRTLGEAVQRAGFTIVRMSYWNCLLLPVVAALRLIERVRGQHGSSVGNALPFANGMLRAFLSTEAWLLSKGVDFPVGASIVCLARVS